MDNKKSKKQLLRKYMRYIFVILVVVFLARYFYRNIDTYRNLDVKISIPVLLAAVVIHFAYKMMQISLWHYITKLNHCEIRFSRAVTAYMYSILGKYIPGKIFMLLARIPAYEEEDRSVAMVTISFFLENICTILGAAFLFLLSLAFFPNELLNDYKLLTILLIIAFFICIHPKIINFVLKYIGKLLKKENLYIPINYLQMISVVVLFILNWIVLGIGFYILACSIYPVPISQALYLSGIFGLSVIIGILAVFSPSGVGVREGIIILGLSFVMPQEYAVLISVVSRLWMTLSELSLVLITWIIDKFILHHASPKLPERSEKS